MAVKTWTSPCHPDEGAAGLEQGLRLHCGPRVRDEAESGRIADRPQFRQVIEEECKATAPFQVILVWKFSRFLSLKARQARLTASREDAEAQLE